VLEEMELAYDSENLMILFGDDFEYDNLNVATEDFARIERLMAYMTEHMGVNMRFGTPSEYFDILAAKKQTFKHYSGDFLPYQTPKGASPAKLYWTGFFATRPLLKKHIAYSLKLNRAANLASGLGLNQNYNSESVAYTLHHDAITGTCRPHVIANYEQMLNAANQSAFERLSEVV
jgi:hypothetical protein